MDARGRALWSLRGCPLCARLSSSRREEELCGDHERRSVEESLRWGEPYISVCPFGLVTFAVPLSRDKKLVAGLVSGFCIFPQMQKDIREDVLRGIRRFRLRTRVGPRSRLSFPVVPSDILRRNAALLFDLTGRYGANDLEMIHESRERSIQQFTIANFLEDARKEKQDLVSSLVRMQNEIIDKVVLGDLSGSREIINRYLGAILLETGMNFNRLKVRLLELIVIISRAAIEKGISAEGLLGPRYSFLTDINAAENFDDLFWKVTKVLENFNRTVLGGDRPQGLGAHDQDEGPCAETFHGEGLRRGGSRRGRTERQPRAAPVSHGERDVPLGFHREAQDRLRKIPAFQHGPKHRGNRDGLRLLRPEPFLPDVCLAGGAAASEVSDTHPGVRLRAGVRLTACLPGLPRRHAAPGPAQ